MNARDRVAQRDGWVCHYCLDPVTPDTSHIDHRTPRARGGSGALWNLVLACPFCNCAKRDRSYLEFVWEGLGRFQWMRPVVRPK